MLRDLGRDSRSMASKLATMLNDLTAELDASADPLTHRALVNARDLAQEVRTFMAWVDEDPSDLLSELQAIDLDGQAGGPEKANCKT